MKQIRTALMVAILFLTTPSVSFAGSQTFTSNGTFTVPAGVTAVTATVIGGGGGFGGGGFHDAMAYPTYYGAPGGSGAIVTSTLNVSPGQSFSVYVGQGGGAGGYAGNAYGGAGYAAGGNSYFSYWRYVDGGGGGGGSSAVVLNGNLLVLAPGGGGGGAPPSFISGTCYGGAGGGGGGGSSAGGSNGTCRIVYARGSAVTFYCSTGGAGGAGGGGAGGHGASLGTCTTDAMTAGGSATPSANNGGPGYNSSGGNGSVLFTWNPDLTASAATPTTATAGVTAALSASIQNIGTAPTGTSFPNFFQVATAANGGGAITDLTATTMPALAAGGSAPTNQSYIFPTTGTYSIRACADKTSSTGGGVITESNENNNCGVWTTVAISACGAGLAYSAASHSCIACSNGGCTGPGGTPSNPNGGLICNNNGTNVPVCTPPAAACTLPWGGTLASGSSISAYSASSIDAPGTCPSISGTCSCNNGTLSGTCVSATCHQTISCGASVSGTISSGPSRVALGTTPITLNWTTTNVANPSTCSISKNGTLLTHLSGTPNVSCATTGTYTDAVGVGTGQATYQLSCGAADLAKTIVNVTPTFTEF